MMKIHTKTNVPTFYDIRGGGAADCGTIKSGSTADLPYYDSINPTTVTFSFPDGYPSISAPGNSQVTIETKQGD